MTEPSSHSDDDALRQRVRAELMAVLAGMDTAQSSAPLPAPATPPAPASALSELAVVLTGRHEPPAAFLAQLAELAPRGYTFVLVARHQEIGRAHV